MEGFPPFSIVDVVAVAVAAAVAVHGFFRRLSGEVAGLIGSVTALLMGLSLCRPLGAWLYEHTRLDEQPARAVAFLVTVIAALIVMVILRALLSKLMKLVFEPTTDRIGGIVAGFLRGTVYVILFFLLMNLWPHEYLNRVFGEESVIGTAVVEQIPFVRERIKDLPLTEKARVFIEKNMPSVDLDGLSNRKSAREPIRWLKPARDD
ncbi:MAG: CvpA family protein [Lentisphaerae bacterium]|nr:CvpA family protein [Lentisphaerota bacterium]